MTAVDASIEQNTSLIAVDEIKILEPPASARRRRLPKVNKCKHTDRRHYAKNLCGPCYRRFMHDIRATKYKHTDRLPYLLGMCQACYLGEYHKQRANAQLLRI